MLYDFDRLELPAAVRTRFLTTVNSLLRLVRENTVDDLQFFVESDGAIVLNDPQRVVKGQVNPDQVMNEKVIAELLELQDVISNFTTVPSWPSKDDFLSVLRTPSQEAYNAFAKWWTVVELQPCGTVGPRNPKYRKVRDAIGPMSKAFAAACDNVDPIVCPRPLDFFSYPHNDTVIDSLAKDQRFVFGYRIPNDSQPECPSYHLFTFLHLV